ncbi:MAG TPA: hypothetical protein GX505_11875 [Clostridiales bacterium]|nr:hypothetical protein [Clostridiales bacterium]
MKKEDLKAAFDKIQIDPNAESRIIKQVISRNERGMDKVMKTLSFKRLVPVMALAVILAGSLLVYNMLPGRNSGMMPEDGIQTDDLGSGREDGVAPVTDQFTLGDRYYTLLHEELREEFGLPAQVNENDIGRRIDTIKSTPDKSLEGKEVFEYLPAGGEAVVVVKRENGYQLFMFYSFESYNNNQDEDATAYLRLYGINGPQDIKKVLFIEYSEQSKVSGKLNVIGELAEAEEIEKFYGYYSVLKNASDKYFEKLFGFVPGNVDPADITIDPAEPAPDEVNAPDKINNESSPEIEPIPGEDAPAVDLPAEDTPAIAVDLPLDLDAPVSSDTSSSSSGMMDVGGTASGSGGSAIPSSQGSAGNALANPIGVRIYNQNGVYYEIMYYPNIGFLSRYEVSAEFADFIHAYIK